MTTASRAHRVRSSTVNGLRLRLGPAVMIGFMPSPLRCPVIEVGDYAHDDVELQLELVVEQHDEVEHEHVVDDVLELVLDDPAKSSLGVESTTSKVSASNNAI